MKLKFLQQGGPMTAEDPAMAAQEAPAEAGAPQGGTNPEEMLMQLAEAAMQALQNQDCQAAMAVCQGFVQMIQGMQGGAPTEEPVYRKGGRLVRKIKRD